MLPDMLRIDRIEKIAVAAVNVRMLTPDGVLAKFEQIIVDDVAARDAELSSYNLAIMAPGIITANAAFSPDPVAPFSRLPLVILPRDHAEAVAAFAYRVTVQTNGLIVMMGVNYSWGMNVRIKRSD